MGDSQKSGPFLGPYYNTGPNTGPNLGDPKRDHNFDNPPCVEPSLQGRRPNELSRPLVWDVPRAGQKGSWDRDCNFGDARFDQDLFKRVLQGLGTE